MSVRGYFICIHLRKVCISGSFFELLEAELLKMEAGWKEGHHHMVNVEFRVSLGRITGPIDWGAPVDSDGGAHLYFCCTQTGTSILRAR